MSDHVIHQPERTPLPGEIWLHRDGNQECDCEVEIVSLPTIDRYFRAKTMQETPYDPKGVVWGVERWMLQPKPTEAPMSDWKPTARQRALIDDQGNLLYGGQVVWLGERFGGPCPSWTFSLRANGDYSRIIPEKHLRDPGPLELPTLADRMEFNDSARKNLLDLEREAVLKLRSEYAAIDMKGTSFAVMDSALRARSAFRKAVGRWPTSDECRFAPPPLHDGQANTSTIRADDLRGRSVVPPETEPSAVDRVFEMIGVKPSWLGVLEGILVWQRQKPSGRYIHIHLRGDMFEAILIRELGAARTIKFFRPMTRGQVIEALDKLEAGVTD